MIATLAMLFLQAVSGLTPGLYFQSGSAWKPMQVIHMAGGGATHMAKMFVPGLTPQFVYTYRDAKALVRIEERRPVFLLKENPYIAGTPGAISPRDVVIVRFDKKKDHRELQTTSGGNLFTFKSGFSKDRAFDVTATTNPDGSFQFTPVSDLKPGEYILITGPAAVYSGYDFGID